MKYLSLCARMMVLGRTSWSLVLRSQLVFGLDDVWISKWEGILVMWRFVCVGLVKIPGSL